MSPLVESPIAMRPRHKPEIAVMDMAGTTIRDEGLVTAAFEAALYSEGIDGTDPRFEVMRDHIRATMGISKIEVFAVMFDGDRAAAKRANRAFENAFQELASQGLVTPIEGAKAAIAALRAGGIKVALTTGFSPATRDHLLTALGWCSLADLALSPADAGRGRPYPDLALTALLRLGGTSVSGLVTVGDTMADIECGLAAGAGLVVGVSTGTHSRRELLAAGADIVLKSIADLPDLLGVGAVPAPAMS